MTQRANRSLLRSQSPMIINGRYEIREQIGTGSMGTVYRAYDLQLDREVALKTIRTGMDVEPEIRERFFREARACARLQHPSIITVYDLGEEKSTAYIAMELLRGMDFRQLIQDRGELSLATKVDIMIQICEALGHAHRHGVIHRDVKPSNLFLINQRQAKVLDFGIARLPSSHLTLAGKILGTPNYMSPEQILGRPVDFRSDLFSVAIVFFELLVYAHPFQGQSIPRRIVESEPDSLFDHDSSLPPLFERIFARALMKDSNSRYRTGDEFAADFRAILDLLRQNASPTFSGIPQLPSERAHDLDFVEPEPKSQVNIKLLTQPPAGEDPYEWRFSEIMRLIPEFEEAMAKEDRSLARTVFRKLEALEAVDSRFTEAVNVCRRHLTDLAEADATVAIRPDLDTSFVSPLPGTPAVCPTCGVADPGPTHSCRNAGEVRATGPNHSMVVSVSPENGSSQRNEPQPDDATQLFAPGGPGLAISKKTGRSQIAEGTLNRVEETAPVIPVPPPNKPVRPPNPLRTRVATAVAALLGMVLIVVLFLANRPIPVSPAAGSAEVSVAEAVVYEQPNAESAKIVSLKPKTRVNLLQPPQKFDQPWVRVQYVPPQGRVFRPGYARTSALTDWESRDPDTALLLLRMFRVNHAGSKSEITSAISALDVFVARFPKVPAASQASLLMAELTVDLARKMKSDGDPLNVWQEQLELARNHLSAASGNPALQTQASVLLKQVDELADHPVTPPAPTKVQREAQVTLPPISVASLLALAEKYRSQHGFDRADALVNRVLQREPTNAAALTMRDRIKKNRSFFDDQH